MVQDTLEKGQKQGRGEVKKFPDTFVWLKLGFWREGVKRGTVDWLCEGLLLGYV